MKQPNAFSLVEVAISVGIIGFALIAILGLLPIGLHLSKKAVDDTREIFIVQDAASRAQSLLEITASTNNSPTATWWYDDQGRYLGTNYATALYRADLTVGSLDSSSPVLTQNPAPVNANLLRAGSIIVTSPVNPATGKVMASTNSSTAVYPICLRSPAVYLQ